MSLLAKVKTKRMLSFYVFFLHKHCAAGYFDCFFTWRWYRKELSGLMAMIGKCMAESGFATGMFDRE